MPFATIIPSRAGKNGTFTQGTQVLLEDGTELSGVTKIVLTAKADSLWHGEVHIFPKMYTPIKADVEIVEDFNETAARLQILQILQRLEKSTGRVVTGLSLEATDVTTVSSKKREYIHTVNIASVPREEDHG